jgi:hypothetical protein
VSRPPSNYPPHPPWGYPPPGYGPPPYPPPGYGYPYPSHPGYGAPPVRHSFVPGVIPLRPLSLSDIFNGAAVYVRANPRATLGLTTAVVVITQIISVLAAIGPLSTADRVTTAPELSGADVNAWILSAALTGIVGWLAGILLTGMLTVVAGRAIFGSTISAGDAWARIRGRLPALIGLVALECVGLAVLAGFVGVIIAVIAAGGGVPGAVILGFPLGLLAFSTVVYLYVALSFAPVLIVLEELRVIDAIRRSLSLVRNGFWRVLGIRMLAWLVVTVVSAALAAPFDLLGALAGGPVIVAAAIAGVGATIGQIVTAPFSAGVVVLLYTDRRIRSEAFDLVLQSGAAIGPGAEASTDYLWLARPV